MNRLLGAKFEVGKKYLIYKDLFKDEIIKNEYYVLDNNGEFHIYNEPVNYYVNSMFKAVRLFKSPIDWLHPFRKKEVIDVLLECVIVFPISKRDLEDM